MRLIQCQVENEIQMPAALFGIKRTYHIFYIRSPFQCEGGRECEIQMLAAIFGIKRTYHIFYIRSPFQWQARTIYPYSVGLATCTDKMILAGE